MSSLACFLRLAGAEWQSLPKTAAPEWKGREIITWRIVTLLELIDRHHISWSDRSHFPLCAGDFITAAGPDTPLRHPAAFYSAACRKELKSVFKRDRSRVSAARMVVSIAVKFPFGDSEAGSRYSDLSISS